MRFLPLQFLLSTHVCEQLVMLVLSNERFFRLGAGDIGHIVVVSLRELAFLLGLCAIDAFGGHAVANELRWRWRHDLIGLQFISGR